MADTGMQEALLLIAACVAAAVLLYGAYRAIRTPLQPFATFIRAWGVTFSFIRIYRRLPLLVLAALIAGQALQTFFHYKPVFSVDTLILISTAWQALLAIFLALCAARFQLHIMPMVTFRPADFDLEERYRRIRVRVALWAAAVWLVGIGLNVLSNLAVRNSAPDWQWYVSVPAPLIAYLLQTPLLLIRPALVFGQTARQGLTAAFRRLAPLLLLNLLFVIPPYVFQNGVLLFGVLVSPNYVFVAAQIGFVLFGLFQFFAYEAASLIAFGIATDRCPQIVFNRTLSAFYRKPVS